VSSVHTNQPWHTDRWFTSPQNHDPEVATSLSFRERITVHDVTLRDGERQAGVEFTADDKVRIAEALSEAGVQRIEAGRQLVKARSLERKAPLDDCDLKRIADSVVSADAAMGPGRETS